MTQKESSIQRKALIPFSLNPHGGEDHSNPDAAFTLLPVCLILPLSKVTTNSPHAQIPG